MITSRKILVVTVLVSLAFVSALPIAIGVKHMNRDFVEGDRNNFDYYKLSPVTFVNVEYLKGLVIVRSDSFRLEVAKSLRNFITITNAGDTLSVIYQGERGKYNDSTGIILYLPVSVTIIALESDIELRGGVNEFPPPPSYTFDLRHSHLSLPKLVYHQFYDHLSVSGADSSSLHISGHNHIWDLQLMNLENTVIEQSVELRKVKTSFEGKSFVETSSSEHVVELKSTSLK